MPDTDAIIKLDQRIRANKFGRIVLEPSDRPLGPHGIITVPAQGAERDNVMVFLRRLTIDHAVNYQRDTLELSYEHGHLTLARITFQP